MIEPGNRPCLTPLEDYALLAIEGERTTQFLQGQLTCDLREAAADRVIPGAWCTPKGRVACSFLLWQPSPAHVLLRLRADLLAATDALLRKYGVFSRVAVSEPGLACIGLLTAPGCAELPILGTTGDRHALRGIDGAQLVSRLPDAGLHELWVPRESRQEWIERLSAGFTHCAPAMWQLALIRAGEAEVQTGTAELFLPQMLDYETRGLVSFRKGCYTGQEIVARTHYKGGVKRHLRQLQGEGGIPPPGSDIRAGERVVGAVVACAVTVEGRFEALAVLADDIDSTSALIAGEAKLGLPD